VQSFFTLAKYNPDAGEIVERWRDVGIEEARNIKKSAALKRSDAEKKVFIINAMGLTREGEAALLKIIEEPPRNIFFVIEAASRDSISDVLRSRLIEITPPNHPETRPEETDELFEIESSKRKNVNGADRYFKTVDSVAKLRELYARPATPSVFIKDFISHIIK